MLGALLVDLGLALLFVGALSVLKPLRFLAIRSRHRGAAVALAGLAFVIAGAALPAPLIRVGEPRQQLDEIIPEYQFAEHHSLLVAAPPSRVFAAVKGVTAREIRLFRLLTWLRAPRLRRSEESILNPAPDRPILEVATSSGFVLLAEEPDREIVLGTLVVRPPEFRPETLNSTADYAALRDPGYAKAVMNFHLTDRGDGSTLLETETRVFATSTDARRAFAPYWRLIYPGSSLIRTMWLRAIRERAEGG